MSQPDSMAQAAQTAAGFASKLDFYLLGAASMSASREERGACLQRVFRQWAPLVRAMSALEAAAPNARDAAYAEDGRVRDIAERHA